MKEGDFEYFEAAPGAIMHYGSGSDLGEHPKSYKRCEFLLLPCSRFSAVRIICN